MRKKIYIRSFGIIIILIFLASSFYYLPFYVSKPGMAKELEPIIKVEDAFEEEGSFMLTTVRMGRANIYSYVIAKLSKYQDIYPLEAIRAKDESEEEYNVRQLYLMSSSKTNAIEVAYKKADIPIQYDYKGVYVLNVVDDMPAEGKLKPGDRIYKVDGKDFDSTEQFINYVSKKNEGDRVKLAFLRNDQKGDITLSLKKFHDDQSKVGVGISLVDDKELEVEPTVHVETSDIGGPSAGLMFSLEIYNQLTKKDYTKGYKIAGTGTISVDGTVGPIGGIEQKIIAADKAGAEIFFAPNENGEKNSNYRDAVKTAKDIGTNMKIVPVDTFDDALEYLDSIKAK
ncbi:SepM family pheromone-processing serine protease [Bacillus massilinigeriensis]|uniref:SepM family pheromone-processing serine protease n=1 Tax=Bacillus massilionigeriensis TaxID=1805475 RepID=UPI00096AE2A9|nr:SepM family pheromone-processing serine protease [Bacillus massilionigeriensis]